MAAESLSYYFQHEYLKGQCYSGKTYTPMLWKASTPVLKHEANDILVWHFALDVRRRPDKESQVIFHYTCERAFRAITAPWNGEFKLWASRDANTDSNFGFGLYGTSAEPASWASKSCLEVNNYFPRKDERPNGWQVPSQLVGCLGTPVHRHITNNFGGKVDFCIAVICDREDAFDIQQRCTPEMKAARAKPGQNRWRDDEPRWRNVWVVRQGQGDDLAQSSEKFKAIMRAREAHYRRHDGEVKWKVFLELAELYRQMGEQHKVRQLFNDVLRDEQSHEVPRTAHRPKARPASRRRKDEEVLRSDCWEAMEGSHGRDAHPLSRIEDLLGGASRRIFSEEEMVGSHSLLTLRRGLSQVSSQAQLFRVEEAPSTRVLGPLRLRGMSQDNDTSSSSTHIFVMRP